MYELDQEFKDLIDKIDKSNWKVTWYYRMFNGYVIEVRNKKTGAEEEKFTKTFGEMEYWVRNTLKVE